MYHTLVWSLINKDLNKYIVSCLCHILQIWLSKASASNTIIVMYLLKPTLGPPKKFQYLTRAEKVVTRFRIDLLRPLSPTFCPEDLRFLALIVDRYWPLTICSWSVKVCRKLVVNTAQLTFWDNSWDMQSGISTRSWILLTDINRQIFHAIPHLNQFTTDSILSLIEFPQLDNTFGFTDLFIGYEQPWELPKIR